MIAKELPQRTEAFYHPEIDVLRFGAFVLVWFSHALPDRPVAWMHLGFPGPAASLAAGLMRGGAYGVDLFFALSSYLITELLLREYRVRKSIDIKSFYIRRILRIWPLYLTVLFAGPPLMRALHYPDTLSGRYLVAFTLFAGNWACAIWGYPNSKFASLWSVSIEEQFYLAWPLIMSRFIHRLRPIAYGLLACSFLARGWLVIAGAHHPAAWCNTLTRLDPIAAGALLASFLDGRTPSLSRLLRSVMMVSAVIVITLVGLFADYSGISTLIGYPLATLAAILLISATLMPVTAWAPGLAGRALVYLGRISYDLYVFHNAAIRISMVPSPSALRWVFNLTGSLALTVLLAVLSYRFIETPFLRLKKRFTLIQSGPQADTGPSVSGVVNA